tara:strand:- start:4087 stop:5136 length:1050 start_codon:yes stop_codon:yes gene_type:complete
MDEPLSDDYSIWGYRLFLDREPESEQTIKKRTGVFKSSKLLRQHFLSSEEFIANNPEWDLFFYLGLSPKMNVSIELDSEKQKELIQHVQETWEALGESEPHWSVLSQASFRSDKIGDSQKDFKKTAEIDMMILDSTLERNDIDIRSFKSCREFGCGVGRVTRLLADRFEEVEGIDISRNHLKIARKSIAEDGLTHVDFRHVNNPAELTELPQTDFIFSVMVLQHNPPPIIAIVLENLLKSLAPNGVALIQIPTYKRTYSFEIDTYIKSPLFKEDELEMHYLPQSEVFEIIDRCNCRPIEVIEDNYIGRRGNELSNTFLIRKKGISSKRWRMRIKSLLGIISPLLITNTT